MPPTFLGKVIMDPVKLAELLRGPNGPVTREMIEVTHEIKVEAVREAPVYKPPDAYSAANRRRKPGTLRDSVVSRIVQGSDGAEGFVGSEDPVALWTHEGTQPHVIRARLKPRLVFFWPKAGKVVAFKQVNHPGNRPNRWLIRARDTVFRRRY